MNTNHYHQRGYIYHKHGAWHVRYREAVDQGNGTSAIVQSSHKLVEGPPRRPTKAVRKLAEEFLRPLNSGATRPTSGITVSDFVERFYWPHVETNKRPSTVNGYKKMWKRYFATRLAVPIRDVKTYHCAFLLMDITRKYHLGARTVGHAKHLLSGIFRYAINQDFLSGPNPVREASLPSAAQPGETYAYSLPEIDRMLNVLPEPSRTLVAVAGYTGIRKGEIRGLAVVNYAGSILHVRRSVWRKHVDSPKGKCGVGAVPVIPKLRNILDGYLELFRPQEFLFEKRAGKPIDIDRITQKVIKPTLEKAGTGWHGWHAFRRGLATNLFELNVDVEVIQAILRHSDAGVTRNAYIKRDGIDRRSRAAMDKLQQSLRDESATEKGGLEQEMVVQ